LVSVQSCKNTRYIASAIAPWVMARYIVDNS
jgi:hypothetical protein